MWLIWHRDQGRNLRCMLIRASSAARVTASQLMIDETKGHIRTPFELAAGAFLHPLRVFLRTNSKPQLLASL